jgi:hypothetical protein
MIRDSRPPVFARECTRRKVTPTIHPTSVSIGDSSAALRIRVYVENPSLHVIRVVTGGQVVSTGDPSATCGLWGSFRIANDRSPLNAGPDTDWWGQPDYVFAPARAVYDESVVTLREWVAGGWDLSPGRYRVRSWFNGREGESAEFVLTP